jgi:inosine/xanthosine triphosphatase
MSDSETFQGALQRAKNAKNAEPDADFWVGIEGGLAETSHELEAFAWVVVIDKADKVGKGRTSTFFLPARVAELVRQGKELGEADDIVFGLQNSKQQMGAIGILTHGIIDRAEYYEQAVVAALIPFKNPELYT